MSQATTFTVLVEALGFASGVARKGETVTAEQIGPENVSRLKIDGIIADEGGAVAGPEPGPTRTVRERLAVGLPPEDGHRLTEEDIAWVHEVKAGVVAVPFDDEAVEALTVREIGRRIEGLGGDRLPANSSKANAVEALRAAVAAFIAAWDVGGGGG